MSSVQVADILKVDAHAPQFLWQHFLEFCARPRPSTHEEKVAQYIINFAQSHHCKVMQDKIGNIMIQVPASPGCEDIPVVMIQNHIDMVTDARVGKVVNFLTDPIIPRIKDQWLMATDTTLGADNGIGACAALALINCQHDFKHPALELLFTLDEETGLTGALQLDASLLSAKYLLNLDTEEWGSLYIGCAGGREFSYRTTFPVAEKKVVHEKYYHLKISGLTGGHSGIDIHRQRGNAHKLMLDFMMLMTTKLKSEFQVVSWIGGKAHNIIPRDVSVKVLIPAHQVAEWRKSIDDCLNAWRKVLPAEEQHLQFTMDEISIDVSSHPSKILKVLPADVWQKTVLPILNIIPDGAQRYVLTPDENAGHQLARLSSNLAKVEIEDGHFHFLASLRFFEKAEADSWQRQFQLLMDLFPGELKIKVGYPSWAPDYHNSLVKFVQKKFQENYNSSAQVLAIHAGLECGIIQDRIPGLKGVSFGPTIMGAHSPDEKVDIKSVTKFWNLLCSLLTEMTINQDWR